MATRVLVLGLGRWGNAWLRALADNDDVELAGSAGGAIVGEPGVSRSSDFAHYADFTEALEGCDADLVIIALPVRLHARAIEMALGAGMHVLCEKPLVTSREDLRRVVAAHAAHPDRQLVVGQNYRRRPWTREARRLIAAGAIGEVEHLSLRFRKEEFLGGGRDRLRAPLLEDMCIHHLDTIRYLMGGEPAEVYAREFRPTWSRYPGIPGLELLGTLQDGRSIAYSGLWAARGRDTAWDGDLVLSGNGGELRIEKGEILIDGSVVASWLSPWESDGVSEIDDVADLRAVLQDTLVGIAEGTEVETGLRDNQLTVEFLLAVADSARLRSPVRIPETGGRQDR